MKQKIEEEIQKLRPGDLCCVDWYDASTGKSLGSGLTVDVPVKSWGIFVGALGRRSKHIILAQNNFSYSDGIYDIDYTAVPVAWTMAVTVIAKSQVSLDETKELLNSFLMDRRRTTRKEQHRACNHNDRLG
jgi:hypothetical protein